MAVKIGAAFVALSVCTYALAGGSNAAALRGDGFTGAVSAARELARLGPEATAELRAGALSRLERIAPPLGEAAGPICAFVKARSDQQAGDRATAEAGFAQIGGKPSVAPEAILALSELNANPPARRVKFELCLAELLPISARAAQRGARESGQYADIKPPRPDVPEASAKRLLEIARLFETLKLYDFAWRAYAEAIYGGLAPSWSSGRPRTEGWLSPDTADLWASAGDCAWRAGQSAIAYDYLAKSVIFGPDEQMEKAKATLAAWKATQGAKEEAVPKEELQEAVAQIVRLYADMNVHPRAVEIVREHPDWVKNPEELQATLAEEWKAVLKSYGRASERVVVYGVEVTDKTDPTRIHVPFACSPGALERVSREVDRLVKEEPAK